MDEGDKILCAIVQRRWRGRGMTPKRDIRLVLLVALLCLGLVLAAGYGPVPVGLSSFVRHWQHTLFAWSVVPGAPVRPVPMPASPGIPPLPPLVLPAPAPPSGLPPVAPMVPPPMAPPPMAPPEVPAPLPVAPGFPSSPPMPIPRRHTNVPPWRPPTPHVELLSCLPCATLRM